MIVMVAWLVLLVGAFDKANISLLLADPSFLKEMALEDSPERQGLVMTLLLLPYALSGIFLSFSADRWGPRRVLSAMVAAWGLAALLLGNASSYLALLFGRALRGIAEGPLFPIANRYVRSWFPSSERGGANAIWTSGQRLGLGLAVPTMAAVIAIWGWRASFFIQAALFGLLLLPAVWFFTADTPREMRRVGEAERRHIAEGLKPAAAGEQIANGGLRELLRNYRYWLAVAHHFAMLAVYNGLITWLPKYLKDVRGFDLAAMVFFASLPHLLSMASGLGFGFLSDRLGRRAVYCSCSLSGAALCVALAALSPDPVWSALLVVLGFGVWGIGAPAYYVIMQRLIPGRIMATGVGIDNGISNIGSALAPAAVGYLIGATGSYLPGLLFLAALGMAGALAAGVLAWQKY